MEKLRYYLRRYPNRIKYGLLLLDLFAMIIAIRVYVNYLSIQATIENTIVEKENKMTELAFTQNFLVNYEKSDFARYFLQHENNMLLKGEYIIKFEDATKKILTGAQEDTSSPLVEENKNLITTPQSSRKRFLQDKMK